ncbi:MAG: GNAT family N-acetyltransferase [Psychrilyobacter sp.]|uniref:GNAT family N-acetyltransferase n=1 Tax=Psychrilyobacter sp. TaxID=2586924 RepID=UPI003C76A55A
MDREMFYTKNTIGISIWEKENLNLALELWGDSEVTKFIGGPFSSEEVKKKLNVEIKRLKDNNVQYYPIFDIEKGVFIGSGGLREYCLEKGIYEIGFHLKKEFWGKGYGTKVANLIIEYAFKEKKIKTLFAGHNPNNIISSKVLAKLGFKYTGKEFYKPTGLLHPSYILEKN